MFGGVIYWVFMRAFTLALLLGGCLCQAAFATEPGKPVAILGYSAPVQTWIDRILVPNQIEFEEIPGWLPAERYPDYSAVVIAERMGRDSYWQEHYETWDEPEAREQVLRYLRDGGVIVLTSVAFPRGEGVGRDLRQIAELVGFETFIPLQPSTGVLLDAEAEDAVVVATRNFLNAGRMEDRIEGTGAPGGMEAGVLLPWIARYSGAIDALTSAEPLAWYQSAEGAPPTPFATVNRVGDGKLYWFGTSLFRLLHGNVDEPFGDAYEAMLTAAVMEGNPPRGVAPDPSETWNPEPLGDPAD